ncbi:MAG: response regulator [Chloroflexi bacterium]|nr:MAG: response regulator [Chloroflexota bacterium]
MEATILYIEDNPDNMTLVRRVVEAIGCTFVGAATGAEGLRQAALLEPDLVLLDINLPDIDGYSVTRRMRASGDPHLVYVPIIAITANAMRGEANKALESGCDVYMVKPVNIRELRARIEAFPEISRGAE